MRGGGPPTHRIRAWSRAPKTWRRCWRGFPTRRFGRSSRTSSSCALSTSTVSRSTRSCAWSTSSVSRKTSPGARRLGRSSGPTASRRAPTCRCAGSFDKLAEEGYLDVDAGAGDPMDRSYRARGPLPPGDPDRPEALARALEPRCAPAFAVVRAMVEHVPEFLRGEKTGEEILFAPTRLPLWFDYFSNENLLYQINNRLGAEAVARALPATGPATILEIGGGSGSAALAVGERLARDGALARIAHYRFTEIVPTFLRRAERTLRRAFRTGRSNSRGWTWIAISTSRACRRRRADVVYAVNTVHIARDLAGDARAHPAGAEARRRRRVLGVRAPVPGATDLRRVRLQLPRELHGRGDGRRVRGPTTGSSRPRTGATPSPPPASSGRRSFPTSRSSRGTTTRSSSPPVREEARERSESD